LEKKIKILLDGQAETTSQTTLSRINVNVGALYAEVDRADAVPTTAQLKARADIERDLSAIIKQWEEIRTKSIPAINQRLKDARLAEIVIEANPRVEEEPHGDEE